VALSKHVIHYGPRSGFPDYNLTTLHGQGSPYLPSGDELSMALWVLALGTFIFVQSYARHIDQWDNSSWCVLGLNIYIFSRFIVDWSIENKNPDMITYEVVIK